MSRLNPSPSSVKRSAPGPVIVREALSVMTISVRKRDRPSAKRVRGKQYLVICPASRSPPRPPRASCTLHYTRNRSYQRSCLCIDSTEGNLSSAKDKQKARKDPARAGHISPLSGLVRALILNANNRGDRKNILLSQAALNFH
jgi:hypothetical protein